MNIIYYDIDKKPETNELDQYGLEIGPFHISRKEVIAFLSLILM
jgi:hypothetical protein